MPDDVQHVPSPSEAGPAVVVGLVATPPDHPARIAARLTNGLADLLAADVDGNVRWDVRTGWGAVAPRRDAGVAGLLDDIEQRRANAGWDIVVCLTDLPLYPDRAPHAARVPLVAHLSRRRRAGLVSLPSLGIRQERAAGAAVAALVADMLDTTADDTADTAEARQGILSTRMVEKVAAIRRRIDGECSGDVDFVSSRGLGQLRLLLGMVRANRPGRALIGLSKLLVGAFGTAAIALATNTVWQISDALDGLRLTMIMLLSIGGLVAWLIVAHDLWERPSADTSIQLARLFNAGTVITLAIAVMVSYIVLFLGSAAAAALLIDRSVLEQTLLHPVGPVDYFVLAWMIASLATVGGAIGSGLEDEDRVRAAAYGHHPEPVGWRDEVRPDERAPG